MNAGAYGGEMKDVLLSCNHLDMNGVRGSFSGDELKLSYRHSVYTEQPLVITGITVKLSKGEQSEINAEMQELLGRRVDKQPLDLPSAGSFFKRPEGHFAGALIEQCGLKGFSVGGAQISEKHAGFVVNKGGATTEDILALSREVTRIVFEQTGVTLEHEVKLIGNID